MGAIGVQADIPGGVSAPPTKRVSSTSSGGDRSSTTVHASRTPAGPPRDTGGAATRDHRGGQVVDTGPVTSTTSPTAPAPGVPRWLIWGGVIAAGLGVAYYAFGRR